MKSKATLFFLFFSVFQTGFLRLPCLAQGQGNGSSISGTVYGENNAALELANIQVKNTSNGFTTVTNTNHAGYFNLKGLPVGTYTIEITSVGYNPQVLKDQVLNLGDHLALQKITLSQGQVALAEIVVKSNSFNNSVDRLGTATAVSSAALQRLPMASRSYTDLIGLSPLAQPTGGSIAGAKAGGTGFLLDGVTNRRTLFGGLSDGAFPISSEVVREFEVVTNSYDVTNGRGSGGVVKAITKSGTNTLSGAAWGYYGANSLAAKKDVNGNDLRSKFQIAQAGFRLGGPIIKDKLHYLVSYDQYESEIPLRAYDFTFAGATQAQGEKNLGITEANLKQVISTLENQYGFPVGPEYGTINIKQVTRNVFTRFDWNINAKNRLTLRYTYQHFDDPNKLKGSGILSTQYIGDVSDHSLMLSLRTDFSPRSNNDLKISGTQNKRLLHVLYNQVPEGFVTVTSVFQDSSKATTTVAFGDQNWVPENSSSTSFQLVDNYTFKADKYTLTLGTDNIVTHITDQLSHDQQGQFYYNSINDLVNNTPYRFNRKIPLNGTNQPVSIPLIELGFYGQVETNLLPNVNLTAGLRWDGTIVGGKPTYNPLLEQKLGIRNDVTPFDSKKFQPRVNLVWDVKSDGQHVVKFGAGLFASQYTTQPFTFSRIDNGIDFRQVDIRTNVPVPDWKAYQSDFNKVPGLDYYNTLNNNQPATVLVLDKNLKNPTTFKTNLSYYRYLTDWFRVGVNVYYNNTANNFYLYDINLKKTPEFVTNEGREVYVPANTLSSTGTGSLPQLKNSRIAPEFNQVRYFTNTSWNSKFYGINVEASVKIRETGSLSASYTRSYSKGNPPYDSGDPRNANFSVGSSYHNYGSYGSDWYSGEDLRNKLVVSFLSPTFYGFNVSSVLQVYQSARFSAYVNRDLIGEANDGTNLAYIYDPNNPSTPENIRADMQTLLQKTSPEFREYLMDNMGKFAPYNGGLQPWRYSWNLSVAKEIKVYKTQRLTLRADIFNVLNLLNYKWGGYNQIINTNLYNVTGFDANTHSYVYQVNTNAGTRQKTASPYYSVQLGVKYSF